MTLEELLNTEQVQPGGLLISAAVQFMKTVLGSPDARSGYMGFNHHVHATDGVPSYTTIVGSPFEVELAQRVEDRLYQMSDAVPCARKDGIVAAITFSEGMRLFCEYLERA